MSRMLLPFAACVCAAVFAAAASARATNAQEADQPTRIIIDAAAAVTIGDPAVINAQLLSGNSPVADAGLTLIVDGVVDSRRRTDANGRTTLTVRRDLVAGQYRVGVAFDGHAGRGLAESSAASVLSVAASRLTVSTVPPLEGMPFVLTSESSPGASPIGFTSGSDGVAVVDVPAVGTYRLEAPAGGAVGENIRTKFIRWGDATFSNVKTISIPARTELQAGYQVDYLVSQEFQDRDGGPLDPSRVSSMTLFSSIGEQLTFTDGGPKWLLGSRVIRRDLGLEETKILYSVLAVAVDGSNVVNGAQYQFEASPGAVWPIPLLLFPLHIKTRDAIFGFPIGAGIEVEKPDGGRSYARFDEKGVLKLEGLARGEYRVRVDAWGLAPWQPVALSQSQEIEVRVISYLDMALVGALGLAFVAALSYARHRQQGSPRAVLPRRFRSERELR